MNTSNNPVSPTTNPHTGVKASTILKPSKKSMGAKKVSKAIDFDEAERKAKAEEERLQREEEELKKQREQEEKERSLSSFGGFGSNGGGMGNMNEGNISSRLIYQNPMSKDGIGKSSGGNHTHQGDDDMSRLGMGMGRLGFGFGADPTSISNPSSSSSSSSKGMSSFGSSTVKGGGNAAKAAGTVEGKLAGFGSNSMNYNNYSNNNNNNNDDSSRALKEKFGNAKAISSDQYFGRGAYDEAER